MKREKPQKGGRERRRRRREIFVVLVTQDLNVVVFVVRNPGIQVFATEPMKTFLTYFKDW